MSRASILVFTSLHLCRNPRVVKEATTLGAAGFDVTVLSVSSSERFDQLDRELLHGLPFKNVAIDLVGRTPAARLRSKLSRGTTWLARRAQRAFGVESLQALGPVRELLARARSLPAALTIAHTEIPLWAARDLIRDGRRVAVDFEDWYSEDLLYADRRSRPLGLLRNAEKFALHHAAYVSTTSNSMASALTTAFGGQNPIVVRNTFPLQPRSRLDRPLGQEPPAFIWFSQTIGPGRGLEMFFAAWNQTRNKSCVFLLGDVRPEYQERLLARVRPERRACVLFLPLVPPHDLHDQLTTFDIGLALESHSPASRDITITNKILQYLNAGLAIVATDTAGQTEVMRAAPGAGVLVSAHETTLLTRQLDELLSDRDALRECQRTARAAAVSQFCWELDAPRLLTAVECALTSPTR